MNQPTSENDLQAWHMAVSTLRQCLATRALAEFMNGKSLQDITEAAGSRFAALGDRERASVVVALQSHLANPPTEPRAQDDSWSVAVEQLRLDLEDQALHQYLLAHPFKHVVEQAGPALTSMSQRTQRSVIVGLLSIVKMPVKGASMLAQPADEHWLARTQS